MHKEHRKNRGAIYIAILLGSAASQATRYLCRPGASKALVRDNDYASTEQRFVNTAAFSETYLVLGLHLEKHFLRHRALNEAGAVVVKRALMRSASSITDVRVQ